MTETRSPNVDATDRSASALSVVDVTKHFGRVRAVDHVSFDLGREELLALVGPSGCGKSTLLRTIAGLHPTESGSITLGGAVVDDGRRMLAPEHRRVGLVFQEHALFPHLSVAKNVAFGIRAGGDTAAARTAEMLELVGLAEHGERYPHELSGGERQRVALARALAPRPALMLLDEPFANLDPNLRSQIRDDVVAILRGARTPAVFVTHDQGEALAVGDRIAVMRAGRIVQLDTPERVFHEPAGRFVAAFMGEADFLTIGQARDDLADADAAWRADLAHEPADRLVMVRPDDIALSPFDDTATATAAADSRPGVVTAAEFRGSTWCYTVELGSGASVRSIRSHLANVPIGTRVAVAVTPGHRPVVLPDEPA